MKDLGFNEFGELMNGNDEESKAMKAPQTEMANLSQIVPDADGEEEAESTEIAI